MLETAAADLLREQDLFLFTTDVTESLTRTDKYYNVCHVSEYLRHFFQSN